MDAKDNNGITNLESVHMLTTPLCVDTRTPCLISPQVRELSSSAEENGVKVRKPYTITKQRERWTEEEHNKFLEALKLYGRAWRCIEEHIGTKTAVQIRSHAQKFFTKVARESSSSDASTLKAIEIPPPRPKRKPIHPYPRKLGNSSDREFPVLEQTQRTFSPTQSVLEQDNSSPTSVLSPFGLDIKRSLIWNSPNSCISPVSSASGSNLGGMPNDQEIGCHSPTASVEKSGCLSSAPTSAGAVTQDGHMMELDVGCEDVIPSNNDSALEAKSLKLFGRTLTVSDTREPSLSNVGNLVQCGKSLPIEVIKRSIDMDPQGPIEPMQHIEQAGLLNCAARSAWNMWPIGMPSMIYCLPHVHEDVSSSGQSTILPTPLWWPYYGPFISPQSVNPDKEPGQPCEEVSDENGMKEDVPWIGSNNSFSGKPMLSKQNGGSSFNVQSREQSKDDELMPALKLKLSENSAFRVHKIVSDKSVRGFMPYRRCVAEKEADHPAVANTEADSKRIQLCL